MNMTTVQLLKLRPDMAEAIRNATASKPLPVAKCAVGPVRKMNKLERDYGSHLEQLKRVGDVVWWAYEMYTFKLAPDCRYTPDFAVMLADMTLRFDETKGYFEEDAKIKIRLAAAMLPHRFRVITREAGQWKTWDVPADFNAEMRGLEILERKAS